MGWRTQDGQTAGQGGDPRTRAPLTGGVTDHGALTGLGDDDHTQYYPVDGSRGLTDHMNLGTFTTRNLEHDGGVTVFRIAGGATSANFIHVGAVTTTKAPYVYAAGSDANIDLELGAKGTGTVNITADLDMGTKAITNVGNVDGRDVSADGSKLDGIEAGADVTDAANVDAAGAVMNTDFAAKGDLLSATGASTPSILSVGTNGQVVVADSTAGTGLTWSSALALLRQRTIEKVQFSVPRSGGAGPIVVADASTNARLFTGWSFADAAEEAIDIVCVCQEAFDSTKALEVVLAWGSAAAAGDVVWKTYYQKLTVHSTDLDALNITGAVTDTVTDTAGSVHQFEEATITIAQADHGLSAGDTFALRIARDGTNGSDSLTSDAYLYWFIVRAAA